jgi:hypothetical protein
MSELDDEERLRRFVLDYCDGRIFTDRQCATLNEVRMCFMPLALAEPGQLPKDIALVYEHISQAGPMAINGLPIFFSMRFLTQAELDRVAPAIESEMKRRSEVKV